MPPGLSVDRTTGVQKPLQHPASSAELMKMAYLSAGLMQMAHPSPALVFLESQDIRKDYELLEMVLQEGARQVIGQQRAGGESG